MENELLNQFIDQATKLGMLSNMAASKLATRDGMPKPVKIRYITPGLVHYEYMNNGMGATVNVPKTALDKMLADPEKSIVGKPVINGDHRAVNSDDYKEGRADGIVTKAWYEPADGWYYCEAMIWDEETRNQIEKGYSVSCEYNAIGTWGPAGNLNQVPYDKEVTDGRYTHLLVTPNPRYGGAKFMNALQPMGGQKMLKILQWLKKDSGEVRNAVEVDARTAVEIDGTEVLLENAIAAFKEQRDKAATEARKAAEAEALKNATKVLADTDSVVIDGKPVTVAELKNAMAAKAKNEKDGEYEKDHKAGDHKDKEMANCPMCNSEDEEEKEKKKKDEEAKNALLMNSQHKLGQHMVPNEKCEICGQLASERLANAARVREGKMPDVKGPDTISDGLARGKKMMGKTEAQQRAEQAKA